VVLFAPSARAVRDPALIMQTHQPWNNVAVLRLGSNVNLRVGQVGTPLVTLLACADIGNRSSVLPTCAVQSMLLLWFRPVLQTAVIQM